MNRNVESHFSLLPHVGISRSKFDRSHSVKTTFNVGDLIPFYVDEVLPGDTFSVDSSRVIRMQSLITPIMDNIYLDTYYFFVPNRLVWNRWKEFNGENNNSPWVDETEYVVPQITSPSTGWNVGTIADYMGIPTGVPNLSVNALPFRAYALICDEWFRDENLTYPLNFPVSSATVSGVNQGNSSYIDDVARGGSPFKVSKYHDYFTSALPAPQKGPDVTLPLSNGGLAPVVTNQIPNSPSVSYPNLTWYQSGTTSGSPTASAGSHFLYLENGDNDSPFYSSFVDKSIVSGIDSSGVYPANLYADLGSTVEAVTINELRMAFQIQKFYERQARGGSRYIEVLKSHFGVNSPDARLQRPEYLGGKRIPIHISQVLQQSQTTDQSAQGTPVGFSLTTDTNNDFTHSFVEHGFVIGVMAARYDHTYQQGLERFWSRKSKFDYYWPTFANIGEQAILNKEIYAQGTSVDDEVFGYQEAWADYRYKPNHVTGEMRSQYAQSLDVWHLADDYSSLPHLSSDWIFEDSSTVNRVLAVSDNVSAQLFADIYIKNTATRPMPVYSVPGFVDHH